MATINVNDLTFGVELEVTVPYAANLQVGGYHNGIQIPALPTGWLAERDGSIRPDAGYMAAEIVSPILKGEDGLKQVVAACEWLVSIGAKVNRSTGCHVHVGWVGDDAALGRLTAIVANFEVALYASTGTRTREACGYCQSVRQDSSYVNRFRDKTTRTMPYERRHVLNLTNLGTRKNTVEFRVFAGTTNAAKVLGHVRMCLGLVEKAVRSGRAPKWIGKTPVATSPLHRKGEGQTELTRLFYGLGWTKGDTDHVFGSIEVEGCPTIAESKAVLMKMAAKYDARREDETSA